MNQRHKRLIRTADTLNTIEYNEEYNENSIRFNQLCSKIEKKLSASDRELIYTLIYHRLMAEKAVAEQMFEEGVSLGIRLKSMKYKRKSRYQK